MSVPGTRQTLETTPQDAEVSGKIAEEFARRRSVLADRFAADRAPGPRAAEPATMVRGAVDRAATS
jgi:hypothetical protein